MAIIGLTHNADGQVKLRRAITTKVAIGMPPKEGQNYPTKLDHFVVLKKGQRGSGKDAKMEWELDQEKMQRFGGKPTELWIVLLDDDPDLAFRTEYAWWAKTGRFCHGDGVKASRLQNGEMKPWTPCAEQGCQDINDPKKCKPSGDLYFMLADYPALGSACRLHTSSYQSIMEIRSALEDLRSVTGGRLLGLRVKLFVRPEKNVFDGPNGRQTGTKWVLGLELAAEDLPKLATSMVETAQLFQGIRLQLAGRTIEYEDDHDDIAEEFNPQGTQDGLVQILPPEVAKAAAEPTEDAQRTRAKALMDQLKYSGAKQSAMLAQYSRDLPKMITALEARVKEEASLGVNDDDAPEVAGAKGGMVPGETPGQGSPTRPSETPPPGPSSKPDVALGGGRRPATSTPPAETKGKQGGFSF